MKKKILITDSLFIFNEHVKRMETAGFEVQRLDKLTASKEEMIVALKDKHGYICGGLEKVDDEVIKSARNLRAISVLASGYTEFLPSYKQATEQGIAIAACPGANVQAVAEYTIMLLLASIRNLKGIYTGETTFFSGRELQNLTLGIVGFGLVGKAVADTALALGMNVIVNSRHKAEMPGVEFVDLPTLLKTADVVSLHVNKINGTHLIGARELAMMKEGSLLISTVFPEVLDAEALHAALKAGKLKFATDVQQDFNTKDLLYDSFLIPNEGNAFNTKETLQRMSDRATNSMINLLTNGDDPDVVNSEFREARS